MAIEKFLAVGKWNLVLVKNLLLIHLHQYQNDYSFDQSYYNVN